MNTRNEIEQILAAATGPMTFPELALQSGKALSTVAHHVKRLRKEGKMPRTSKRRKLSLVGDNLRPAVARDRCAVLVERLGEAKSLDEALQVYDGLVELLEVLEVMAA